MNKFLSFFNPFFAYIDTGKIFRKPFGWLYGILAIVNALLPFIILYWMIDSGLFSYAEGGQVIGLVLLWLVVLAAGWFSVLLWWNRMSKVTKLTSDNDDFVVTPAYAHLLQTFGEWLGGYIAIFGALSALVTWLFFGSETGIANALFRTLGLDGVLSAGPAGIILAPVYGFLLLIIFRFVAELSRALACIANNTKKR
ncbi:MAG: hypothetical protein LBU42_04535 [Prevotellaceae bacterium]|jgi:hypothetical protein|nr:hypothetical protein [Prevotellaceae bacterium]